MSNEKPIKLRMTFKEALQMIAKGGKPREALAGVKTRSAQIPSKKGGARTSAKGLRSK